MSRTTFIVGLSALALTAAPAFAQGTDVPKHVTHPAPTHKMAKAAVVHPDMSADSLNAKELASIQGGASAAPAPMPMPAKKTP
jgi:hypothetical protein